MSLDFQLELLKFVVATFDLFEIWSIILFLPLTKILNTPYLLLLYTGRGSPYSAV